MRNLRQVQVDDTRWQETDLFCFGCGSRSVWKNTWTDAPTFRAVCIACGVSTKVEMKLLPAIAAEIATKADVAITTTSPESDDV